MLDIDPGTEANPAVAEWQSAGLRAPDMQAVHSWRLQRLRSQLEAENMAGIVLFDPLNIRYALDATNMQVGAPTTRCATPSWPPTVRSSCSISPGAST